MNLILKKQQDQREEKLFEEVAEEDEIQEDKEDVLFDEDSDNIDSSERIYNEEDGL